MWMALALPPLLLPALLGFSRFESRMLNGPVGSRGKAADAAPGSPTRSR
jgi:hypothetical protein